MTQETAPHRPLLLRANLGPLRPRLRRRLSAYRYRRTIGYGRLNCLRYVLAYDPR